MVVENVNTLDLIFNVIAYNKSFKPSGQK